MVGGPAHHSRRLRLRVKRFQHCCGYTALCNVPESKMMSRDIRTCLLAMIAVIAVECHFGRPIACADGPATDASDVFSPQQADLPVAPPDEAIVLFGGRGTNLMLSKQGGKIDWPIEDGALVSSHGGGNTNHLVSKLHFRDADIHVEFMLPEKGSGNSGVYIHGNYEFQIFNSFGKAKPGMGDAGAIYGFSRPLVNACRKPGQWQVVDIRYRAPRRGDDGQITDQGSITAYLNGAKVQDNATFGEPRSVYHPFRYGTTPYLTKIWERQKKTGVGPVFLQDHHNAVRFRNVWVRPLDDRAFLYEPEK